MAIEDYYIDIFFVEKVRQSDGTGGFKYIYFIGEGFRGSVTKSSTAQQTLAGIRGEVRDQYTITTPDNIALQVSDAVMFKNADNVRVYLKITSNPTYTPDNSGQSKWKYMTATEFDPEFEVAGGS